MNPPASPALGACHIVRSMPTGASAGLPKTIAAFTSGGWRFRAPVEGMSVDVKASSIPAIY